MYIFLVLFWFYLSTPPDCTAQYVLITYNYNLIINPKKKKKKKKKNNHRHPKNGRITLHVGIKTTGSATPSSQKESKMMVGVENGMNDVHVFMPSAEKTELSISRRNAGQQLL